MLLPVAGHSPHLDQPDAVIAAISRFVREHADPAVPLRRVEGQPHARY